MKIPFSFGKKEEGVDGENKQQVKELLANYYYKKKSGVRGASSVFTYAIVGSGFVVVFLFMAWSLLSTFNINVPDMLVSGVSQVLGKNLNTDEFGRTNILLVGVGGAEHDGPNLTDTLMIASLNHENDSLALLSIPRDLYVMMPKVGGTKINSVYEYAFRSYLRESGLDDSNMIVENTDASVYAMDELKSTIERVIGTEIQYYARVDFQGFVDMVDIVDGIEVDVPYNFLDRQYPDKNQIGYETFYLPKGRQILDGETALKYARSRHSTSDFDRADRQQTIIKALLDKALAMEVLTNPSQLRRMYLSISSNFTTDLDWREILRFAEKATKLDRSAIANVVLHDDPSQVGGLLYSPNRAYFNGLAVLLPQGAPPANPGYYKNIHYFANLYFNNPAFFADPPEVLVLNATLSGGQRISGVASEARAQLKQYGLRTVHVGDAPAGYYLAESQYYYKGEAIEDLVSDNLQLVMPSEEIVYEQDEEGQLLNVAYADEPLEDMLAEAFEEYDVVFVVGNDYLDLLP